MKKLFTIIFLFFTLLNSYTIFAQWQWADNGAVANKWDAGYGIATDQFGNAYAIGMFSSDSIVFGAYTLRNANPGMDDVFIVKYSSAGNPLWAKRAGGTNYDYGMAIATDALGNVLVTGHYYSSSIIFGNDTLKNTPGGGTDIYTVKFSSAGNKLWARTSGGINFDESTTICTDTIGNVYVAGEFYSPTMVFGSYTVTNTSTDTLDMFIVKYDPAGNVLWAKAAGGHGNDAITSVVCDKAGNVIVTGTSGSPVCNFGTVTLTNPGILGYNDVFTVKYDSNGNSIGGKRGAGAGFESGTGVATDTTGNVFVTGNFSSVYVTFENDTLYNTRTIGGPTDIFIVKYNSLGTLQWARSAGKKFIDVSSAIVTDIYGNAYITGYFQDTIRFGNTSLINAGVDDIFVAKYSSSGIPVSANSTGGTGSDKSLSLSRNTNGELFIAGEFQSNTFTAGTSTLVNSAGGYSDMFVAKLSLPTGINENADEQENDLVIFPNPTSGLLTIRSLKYHEGTIRIMNALSEIIYQSKLTTETINLSDVSKGIYIVQITQENKAIVHKKIIVE